MDAKVYDFNAHKAKKDFAKKQTVTKYQPKATVNSDALMDGWLDYVLGCQQSAAPISLKANKKKPVLKLVVDNTKTDNTKKDIKE